jgi:hypothetical protein
MSFSRPCHCQEHNICFTTVDRPDEIAVAKIENEAPNSTWNIWNGMEALRRP